MAKEYIEREEFQQVLRKSHEAHANNSREASLLERDIRLLNEQPTADVIEVVRCKDCVYSKNYTCTRGEMYDDTRYRPDYFCADGERRTDDAKTCF